MTEITSLKGYHKNPRKIKDEDFKLLTESLQEFGDLSGIVVNKRTGEIVGGNQRTTFFKTKSDEVEIVLTDELAKPTPIGTVAFGYVLFKGERFNYREVDWDEAKEERANLLANKVGGEWDWDKLANEFDIDVMKDSGFHDFELGFKTTREEEGMAGIDNDTLKESMESYVDGNIKQVVLYFSNEEFEDVMTRLDKVSKEFEVTSNTEAFLKLLEYYENNRS